MGEPRRAARAVALAEGLQVEDLDGVILLLDSTSRAVIQLEGYQATLVRHVIDGTEPSEAARATADVLVEAGILVHTSTQAQNGTETDPESDSDSEDGAVRRRKFLAGAAGAAVATGIGVFNLPSAAAAQSAPGGGGGGGGGAPQPPSPPAINGNTPGDGSVTIDITQPDNGGGAITNYEYSIDNGAWTPFSPAQTSGPFTISGLTGPATISLRAVNASGASTPSGSVSVTPLVLPVAPIVTAATTATLTSATLTFTQGGTAPVTGYEASTDGGGSWTAVSASSGTATVNGIVDGSAIRLRAVNADGASAGSNPTTAAAGSQTFTSSGTFTVPAGVTLVDLELYGGAGADGQTMGSYIGGTGGQPAKVTGRFAATPGSTRAVVIGLGGSGSSRGTGDGAGGNGGVFFSTSSSSVAGGSGGGGGGASSVKGSGLVVTAGGGGGGGGAALSAGPGGNATLAEGGGAGAGWADDCHNGGGGGGGGGGGAASPFNGVGSAGASGYNATTPGGGGGRGDTRTVGLTAGVEVVASGRATSRAVPSQSGDATFRWTKLTVS